MSDNLNSKYMIQKYRQDIRDCVSFEVIRDKCYSKSVLTFDEIKTIDKLDEDIQMDKFIDLTLNEKDDCSANDFINCLNEIDLKVYKELFIMLTDTKEFLKMKEKEGEDAIIHGRIPRTYDSYITRKEENNLKQMLANLKASQILVLNGFPMVGKTSLACRVLHNPELVFDLFKNKVFWVDLHDVKKDDHTAIEDHLKRLIDCVAGYNNWHDSQQERSLGSYKDLLRSKFVTLCNGGLLVLDNVHSDEVFQHFDINCKMLVIVNNKACVSKYASYSLELENFTEAESIACFNKILSIDIDQLLEIRPIARKIHQSLEGYPEFVMLVATYLRQQVDILNKKCWDDMLARVQGNGDITRKMDRELLQKPLIRMTNMLLELLNKELGEYFNQLAILPEHVNISPEVLSVFWEISDVNDVKDILNRFHELSLLERTTITNENKHCKFIYGLRNLLLNCLKSNQTDSYLINCHQKILKAYKTKYGDPSMLPNDNYIYNYYGYHLLGANMPAKKFGVFLDLRFIDANIKSRGVGDMLQDFRIYKKYITMDDRLDLVKKWEAYSSFISTCETNLLRNGLDLVQYALRSKDNHQIVFNDAVNIAKASTRLYFAWTSKNEPHFTRTLDVQNRFETVLFANDPKLILIGTSTGDIQLWDLDSRLMILKYVGHKKGIKQLKLSPCKKFFLSISHDKTFKIWKINHNDLCHNTSKTVPLSPSLRQRDHHSFFADEASESPVADSAAISTISTIASATFYINSKNDNTLCLVTCPGGGIVEMWTFDEDNKISPLQSRGQLSVASVVYSTFDLVVSGRLFLFVYSQANKQLYVVNPELNDGNNYVFITSFHDSDGQNVDIHQILAANDELCVAIGKNIHIIRFQYELHKETVILKHHDNFELPPQGGALSCASLTEDGTYLVTGTVDGFILLWDLQSLSIIKEFATNNRLVIGLDTYTTPDSITLLLSGSDDSTVKCWHIPSEHLVHHHDNSNNISSVRRSSSCVLAQRTAQRQMISCYWPSDTITNHDKINDIKNPSVAVLDEDNSAIQIYNIHQLHTDKPLYSIDIPPLPSIANDDDDGLNKSDVTLFQLDHNAIYYALRSGAVRRYNLPTGTDVLLWNCNANAEDRQISLLSCLKPNIIVVGCNRNSLSLMQCTEVEFPRYDVNVMVNELLNPSVTMHNDNIVRIFPLCQINVRVRMLRFLIAYGTYLYVLNAESTVSTPTVHERCASDVNSSMTKWMGSVNSSYRILQRDVRITNCILSSSESHLVLFLSNEKCDILRLTAENIELSYLSVYAFQINPNVKITASAISFDGQFLALGKESGDIEIIDITYKTSRMILGKYKQPIETLLFSPSPNYILVSIAKTICWWKLQKSADLVNLTASGISMSLKNNVWRSKEPAVLQNAQTCAISENSKYLLAEFSLSGPMKHVTASKDFTSFVTLDSLGNMHSFNVIA